MECSHTMAPDLIWDAIDFIRRFGNIALPIEVVAAAERGEQKWLETVLKQISKEDLVLDSAEAFEEAFAIYTKHASSPSNEAPPRDYFAWRRYFWIGTTPEDAHILGLRNSQEWVYRCVLDPVLKRLIGNCFVVDFNRLPEGHPGRGHEEVYGFAFNLEPHQEVALCVSSDLFSLHEKGDVKGLLTLAGKTRPAGTPLAQTATTSDKTETGADRSKQRYVFQKQGKAWKVVFLGQEQFIPDTKWMVIIAYLLKHEDKGIPARELSRLVGAKVDDPVPPEFKNAQDGDLAEIGLRSRIQGDSVEGDLKDDDEENNRWWREKFESEIKEAVNERDRAKTKGDFALEKDWDNKIEELERYYEEQFEPSMRSDDSKPQAERIRGRVAYQIKSAIKHIEKHHPPLGQHLRSSIKTPSGYKPSYEPLEPMGWEVNWDA